MLDRKQEGKRVLDAITPVRKRAGKVRDMDVPVAHEDDVAAIQVRSSHDDRRL